MLKGFIREELWNLFQGQGTGLEVAVLEGGIETTIKIKITGGEVVAEAGTDMSVTRIVERIETIVDGAGVAVPVLIILEVEAEAVMMMNGGAAVDQLIVHPLLGAAQVLE